MKNTSLLIVLLLLVDSMHYIYARLMVPHLPPSVSSFFVLLVGVIEVGIYGLVTKQLKIDVFRKNAWFFIGIGLLVAGATNLNYAAVGYIDPGVASLIAQTGKIWGLGLGLFWLKDKLARPQFLGAVFAIGGVFVITYQAGELLRIGSFLVLGSTFFYAIHAGITKKYGEGIDFLNFFFFRLLLTATFLFVITFLLGTFTWPSSTAWWLLLLIGTMDVTLSRSIYYLALRRLDLSIHTLVLTLSPVVTIIWTIIFFAITPTPRQLIGGLVVIAGVFIVGRFRESDSDQGEPLKSS